MGPAEAIKDHIRDWYFGSGCSNYTSMAVISDGNSYGIPKGIGFSLPCYTKNFDYQVIDNLELEDFTKKKLEISYKEIIDELSLIGFEIK
jgi:malate/lactate dehydrogenase